MIDSRSVLVVVDVQNDFLPGGALAVPNGHEVIPTINRLARRFENVILTQDWHPAGHISFATTHLGRDAFDTVNLDHGVQVLWPDHCVQGTPGAQLHDDVDIPHAQLIVRKGFRHALDSYSAFVEADRKTPTGLAGYLRDRALERCFIVGLATDYCVGWTALDARRLGFEATVIEDACRGIDNAGSLAKAWNDMEMAGVTRMRLGVDA